MKASTGLAQKIIVLTCGSRGELQGPRLDTAVRNDMPNMVLRPSRTRFASGAGGFHLLVPQPPMTPGVEGRDAAIYKHIRFTPKSKDKDTAKELGRTQS